MLTLIIDADDTLWENNIYYEDCVRDFAAALAREGFDPEEAQAAMSAVERERIPQVGYSPEEFARSLVLTYERLCARHARQARQDLIESIWDIGRRVSGYPIVLLDGVKETLDALGGRHHLILLTKGDEEVQLDKLARSGLRCHFESVHVVAEKDADVFSDLVRRYDLDPERTWMVGNSPRSDINPAVEAGLGGVYVPHPNTWELEIEGLVASDRVTVLERFAELPKLISDWDGSTSL